MENKTKACDFTSSGLKTNLKNLVGNTLWHTGSNDGVTYTEDNIVTSKFYELERSSNNGKICKLDDYCNDTVTRTTTWTGKVGLMYPSDYGYATGGGSTSNRTSCLAIELYNWGDAGDCKNNDWLYNSNAWQQTISPSAHSWYASYVFGVDANGAVEDGSAYPYCFIRPSVYLKSNVLILSGEGTLENPYEIAD